MIFVPDVCYFCGLCAHVWCAGTCGFYSSKHEDIRRYPNLKKITKTRRCNSSCSWRIYLFEEKSNTKRKKFLLFYLHHKNELISANTHPNVMKPKQDVTCNTYYTQLYVTSDYILKNYRSPNENFMISSDYREYLKKSSEVNQKRFNISLQTYFGFTSF